MRDWLLPAVATLLAACSSTPAPSANPPSASPLPATATAGAAKAVGPATVGAPHHLGRALFEGGRHVVEHVRRLTDMTVSGNHPHVDPLGTARCGGILDAKGAPTRRPAPLAPKSDCRTYDNVKVAGTTEFGMTRQHPSGDGHLPL